MRDGPKDKGKERVITTSWASWAQCSTTVDWTPDNSLFNRFRLWKRQIYLIFNGEDDETKVNFFVYSLSPTGITLTSGQVV